jgi:hypothetical protein
MANVISDAEDEYLPSGPPMSPLTKSYFTNWAFFDLYTGINKETFGTVAIDMCRYLKVDGSLVTIFECMQNSRMGFYINEGFSGKFVRLKELVTENEIKVIIPSRYIGRKGEMVFARAFPRIELRVLGRIYDTIRYFRNARRKNQVCRPRKMDGLFSADPGENEN